MTTNVNSHVATVLAQDYLAQSPTFASLDDEARKAVANDLAYLTGRNTQFMPGDFVAYGQGRVKRGLSRSDDGETKAVSYSNISDLRVAMQVLTHLVPSHFAKATARDYIRIMRELGADSFILDEKFSIRVVTHVETGTIKSITLDGGATEFLDRFAYWIQTTLLNEANNL